MKASAVLALATTLVAGVSAGGLHAHRHEHLHEARDAPVVISSAVNTVSTSCGCTTVYTTFYGVPTLLTSSAVPSSSVPTSTVVAPTNVPTTFATPGVYTIPATTLTVQSTVTVCNAASTQVTSGTNVVGGVVTVVQTATTVVCPYATTTSVSGTVISTISTTQYVCPSAGTYTIGAITTVAAANTVFVFPTPAVFTPGVYTRAQAVVTVTQTAYAYVCPFSSAAIPAVAAPTSAPSASSAPAQSVQVAAKVQKPSTGVLGTDTDIWAITYTQYTSQGGCKDASVIKTEIAGLAGKGFTTVRMYGTDCSGLTAIGDAVRAAGIKMIIGVFIDGSGVAGAASQVTDIIAWAQWDIVELIICGNEAVFGKHATAGQLVEFVGNSKASFKAAGYTGLVSLTETVDVWQNNAQLFCSVVDVVTFNSHAFFNAETTAAQAGAFMETQFAIMNALCPGLPESYNTESGWPTAGSCNGVACPGIQQQADAMAALRAVAGGKTVVFSFQNDYWKPAVDQHWGVMGCY